MLILHFSRPFLEKSFSAESAKLRETAPGLGKYAGWGAPEHAPRESEISVKVKIPAKVKLQLK